MMVGAVSCVYHWINSKQVRELIMDNIFARKVDLVRFVVENSWQSQSQLDIPFTYIAHGQHVKVRLSYIKLLSTRHRLGYATSSKKDPEITNRVRTLRRNYSIDVFVYNWAGGHYDYNYVEVNAFLDKHRFKLMFTFNPNKSIGVELLSFDDFLGDEDGHLRINGRIKSTTKRMYIASIIYAIAMSLRHDNPLDQVLDYLAKYITNKVPFNYNP